MHRRFLVLALLLAVALGIGSSVAQAGNNGNAKACQKNGWQSLQTGTGGAFANQSECVSYGAGGGTLFGPSVTARDNGCVAFGGVLLDDWSLHATGFTPNSVLFVDGHHASSWVFDASGAFTVTFVADGPGFTVSADFVDGNGVHASVTFGPTIDCSP